MAVYSANTHSGTVHTLPRTRRRGRSYPLVKTPVTTSQDGELARQLVDVAIRLHDRFSPEITFADVLVVVDACRRDLDIATSASLPEFVERLAAQRILDTINGTDTSIENGSDEFLLRPAVKIRR